MSSRPLGSRKAVRKPRCRALGGPQTILVPAFDLENSHELSSQVLGDTVREYGLAPEETGAESLACGVLVWQFSIFFFVASSTAPFNRDGPLFVGLGRDTLGRVRVSKQGWKGKT